MEERVLILDFGSQVTQLIARRVREAGVYCEIRPYTSDMEEINSFNPSAVILSGGPASVTQSKAPRPRPEIFKSGIPILGICYGQQIMCEAMGGNVENADEREFGRALIDITASCELFEGVWKVGSKQTVWMSHGDRVTSLPPGFSVVACSDGAPYAATADEKNKFYGVQFHPEVIHTPDGAAIIRNFVQRIAKCSGNWTMSEFKDRAKVSIQEQVGKGNVICGLSGGVDSSVVAALLNEAVGDQLTCVFVDSGLLRHGEVNEVVALFREKYNLRLIIVDAADEFFENLKGVTDPEEKRKIIGSTFIDVFERAAKEAGGADFLAQGTLYPDVIESVSVAGPSAVIKSHHNVGGLPERMNLKLVEPVRELFKDEVRELGRQLGLSEALVGRHPFPGPGLAIRIPGAVTREKANILRSADMIFLEEIRKANLYDKIWQAFVVLLPVRAVGVMGDARTYDNVCALRAITSTDGMTADFYAFDMEFLGRVANRIVNEVRGINRVVYDVTSKPPGTIEWE
ncbi:MAG: glutamine-hydrolyzing GMP synthase [Rhodospirillaceae bacterium]|nr:glutamine-hydrolyzing GMP synthase [Rhodospirillaceae bacterium]|tara:strand:+ start:4871 stop:6415 length:1545 start_codon:yes stop_codon:yes gene_type:complete